MMAPHTGPGEPAERLVLSVNAGSSSLKFGLYGAQGGARWSGEYDGLEPGGQARVRLGRAAAEPLALSAGRTPHQAALAHLVGRMEQGAVRLAAVVHRIVHGGDRCVAPCRLDAPTLDYLATLNPLAPLHQPHNLAGVAVFAQALPGVPQIGCFDTAFHATLPEQERRLPLPRELAEQGIRRYGFHGLSYDYVSRQLAQATPRAAGRVLMAHLGNGASLCATLQGRSHATSMGFSALDGLMMGTRCGALDPGVLLHLLRAGWDLPRIERLLYKQSGLLGVSGVSADMRTLRASADPRAAEAIELFLHRLRRELGGLVGLLGGLDVLAFTGGIGEHDVLLRAALLASLQHLGVRLDAAANQAAVGAGVQAIHAPDSAVEVWVVPTDEGRVAAQGALALLDAAG